MSSADERSASVWSPLTLWTLAVAFFIIGDLLTTSVGLSLGQVTEAGPIVEPIVYRYGLPGMVALKLAVVGFAYLAWRLVPDPERVGIPIGLLFVGALVTVWNALVLFVAFGFA